MDDAEFLAERFEAHRPHLRVVAYRMLGSAHEADDAVQEAWLRLSRSDTRDVENLGGWLTTVLARVCLNVLQSRKSRREEPLEAHLLGGPGAVGGLGAGEAGIAGAGPEDAAVMADSVGLALLVVLDKLTPAERLAFVLHDLFAVPFDEIAPIVGKSSEATRQLASRARRRVRGAEPGQGSGAGRQREVVAAFLAASRGGDFDALLTLLDPEVVLRADPASVAQGAPAEARGAQGVADTFSGRARAARLASIDGVPGAVWSVGGVPRVVFAFTVDGGTIRSIELIADPATIARLDVVLDWRQQ
jgi:RNA polymerase sigma-70 factor, ECF subfamily